jgi:chemotaxis signal transduction protein
MTDATTAAAPPFPLASSASDAPRIGLRPHPALPWLLLPNGVPAQVLTEAAQVKVPNTRKWFRGVVSQRGNLLPVFDIGEWAGHGPTVGDDRQGPVVVVIGIGTDAFALLSHLSPGLVRVGRLDASPAGGTTHGALTDYLGQAWAVAPGGADTRHAYDFDARRWLGDVAQHLTGAD